MTAARPAVPRRPAPTRDRQAELAREALSALAAMGRIARTLTALLLEIAGERLAEPPSPRARPAPASAEVRDDPEADRDAPRPPPLDPWDGPRAFL